MTGTKAFHALGLHMHQPPGNFKFLIETNPWEAEQIIRCYAWDLSRRQAGLGERGRKALARARTRILESQTSCFLFWGDAWIPHLYARADAAERDLAHAERDLGLAGDDP